MVENEQSHGEIVNQENTKNNRTYDWLEDALLTVCRNAFPREASLSVHSLSPRLHRVSAHRDYEFVLQSPDTEIRLALRLHHGLFSLWGAPDRIKPAREYSAMLHAYQSGIPTQFPYGFTTSEQPFGKPYLLHDPGDGQRWWEMEDSLRLVQGEMIHLLAEELVKLHGAATAHHPLIPDIDAYSVIKQLWNRIAQIASDELKRCFDNCRREIQTIPPLPGVMLHGQFDLDHILIQSGRIRTITDWEHAAFGDPRWDIAYTSLSLQLGRERSLANQFVSQYAQLAELSVEHLGFWEGLVALRDWAHSVWLRSLEGKSFHSIVGLQTPLIDREDIMRERALNQFS